MILYRKVSVVSDYRCDCSENAFHFEFEEKKSVDFARECLSNPRFTDHLLFKDWFLLRQGVILKSSFTVMLKQNSLCVHHLY